MQFVSENLSEFIFDFKKQDGGNIWLVGGGQINTKFLNSKLIDELWVFVMPIILSDGINLLEDKPNETMLELFHSETYSNGVAFLKYRLK